jgi:hypothetical protein
MNYLVRVKLHSMNGVRSGANLHVDPALQAMRARALGACQVQAMALLPNPHSLSYHHHFVDTRQLVALPGETQMHKLILFLLIPRHCIPLLANPAFALIATMSRPTCST